MPRIKSPPDPHQMLRSLLDVTRIRDRIFLPTDEQYWSSLNSYFSNQDRPLAPLAIARPQSTSEVASLIITITRLHETKGFDMKFEVRSRGDCAWPGATDIQDGIIIDLSALNQVEHLCSQSAVEIGAGAVWGDVYNVLAPLGICAPGGRVADVGVRSLILGGGISWYSPRVGFMCDNVVCYEIILAEGMLKYVTQESHPDLWWALKGGGNNFGIVTKFRLRAFASSNLFGGCFLFPFEKAKAHIKAFHDFAKDQFNTDVYVGANCVYSFRAGEGRCIFNTLIYTKPDDNPAALSRFLDIDTPIYSTARVTTQHDLAFEQAGLSSEQTGSSSNNSQYCCYMTTSVMVDLGLLNVILEIWDESIADVEGIPGVCWAIAFQVIHPATTRKSKALGGNCMGLSNAPPLVIILLTNFWENASDNDAMLGKTKSLLSSIETAARRRMLYSSFKYPNYAWHDQDVFTGYGMENKSRLQEIAKKYDPEGFYQKLMPGCFKLF